tara:strand:- start:264 stop:1094 length:831 start_codon:yes stop_codon:yes gene_type:complete
MKLIHLTDTHIVPKGETLYGRNPAIMLEQCIGDINENHSDANLCVITGDLTHWGELESFHYLKTELDKLSIPVQLLIGNHDSRAEFAELFPSQYPQATKFMQSYRIVDTGVFLFLDTVQEGHHKGWYCQERLNWLNDALHASRGRHIYIFMHHPPFDIGITALDNIGFVNSTDFREVLEPYIPLVRHIFFGHIHRPLAGSWLGMPISSLPSLNHQVRLDIDKNIPLYGKFEPPMYAVVLISPESVIIHNHQFADDSAEFDMANPPITDWATKKHRL